MATNIKLKKSSVPGRVPLSGDLDYGELAINYADGKIYYKNSSNQIKAFIDSASIQSLVGSGGGAVAGVDSAAIISLIDSAYVSSRLVFDNAANVELAKQYASADSGQTLFSGLTYQSKNLLVFLNGIILDPRVDYTANDGSTLTLTAAADSGDELFLIDHTSLFNLENAIVDSQDVTNIINTAYVQARQDYSYSSLTGVPSAFTPDGVDSGATTNLINTAYIQARQDFAYSSLTGTPNVLDSADVTNVVDTTYIQGIVNTAYVQARQDFAYSSLTGTPNVLDSADVLALAPAQDFAYSSLTGVPNVLDSANVSTLVTTAVDALVNGAPAALDTLNELAIALNDDSDAIVAINNTLALKLNIADVTPQDFAYSSLTGTPNVLDSAGILSFIDQDYIRNNQTTYASLSEFNNDTKFLDSNTVTGVIDATYIQSNQTAQDFAYSSLTGTPNILDSADILSLSLDTSEVILLIDSAYVQARQTSQDFAYSSLTGTPTTIAGYGITDAFDGAYASLTGAPNVLDSADVLAIAPAQDFAYSSLTGVPTTFAPAGVDSAATLSLIDATYIQSNQTAQDFAYSSLTGTPNILDSADVLALAPAQDFAYSSLTGTPNVLDSADVLAIANAAGGVDSAAIEAMIDSNYVASRVTLAVDSALINSLIDSALGTVGRATVKTYKFIADSGDTIFTGADDNGLTLSYNNQLVQVYMNGLLLAESTDYTKSGNDTITLIGGADSGDELSIVDFNSFFTFNGFDSAGITNIIDASYIQANQTTQDFAYSSLTGAPNILDSADVLSISPLQDFAYSSLTGAPSIPSALTDLSIADGTANSILVTDGAGNFSFRDSATLSTLVVNNLTVTGTQTTIDATTITVEDPIIHLATSNESTDAIDIGFVGHYSDDGGSTKNHTGLIRDASDQEYYLFESLVQASLDSADPALTVNVGGTNWSLATFNTGAIKASSISINGEAVDSAYVQARQDYAYASLTGTPNILDSADVISISPLQDFAYSSLTGTPNILDSADVISVAASPKEYIDSTTYTVTVASKTSGNVNYNTGSSNAYFLGGIETPFIEFVSGQTYVFDQSDASNSGHPIRFYYDLDKTTLYSTGVTVAGTAGSAGASTTIIVDDDTPARLYYQCQNHDKMGWAVGVDTHNVTGLTTDDLTEGATNRYFSNSLAQAAFTGGTGVTVSSGQISIGQAVGTSDNVTFSNLIVSGNLTVNGSNANVSASTLTVADNIITLNNDETGTPSQNVGFEVERGTAANVSLIWAEDSDNWQVTTDGTNFYRILTSADTISADNATSLNGQTASYYLDYTNFTNTPTSITDFSISDGSAGQVLTTDGSGNFSFTTVSGGSGGGVNGSNIVTEHKSTASGVASFTTSANTYSTVQVFVNGVLARDSADYSWNDSSGYVIFNTAPPSGSEIMIYGHKTSTLDLDSDNNLSITGGLNVGNHSSYNSSTSTNATSNEATIDTWSASTVRGAKYVITVQDTSGNYQISEALVIHDGTTATITTYGTINTGSGNLAVFDAEYSSGNILIKATPTTSNTTYKIVRTDVVI